MTAWAVFFKEIEKDAEMKKSLVQTVFSTANRVRGL